MEPGLIAVSRGRASRGKVLLDYTIAAPHAGDGDVDNEEVAGPLGRADHVLARWDELHNALAKLRAGVAIAPPALVVEVAEVGRGHHVELGADVASPSTTVL
jgi:hypothetical protein